MVKPLERKLREISGLEHIYGMAIDNVGIINVMYKIGEIAEAFTGKLIQWIKEIVNPTPSQKPPRFKFLKKLIKRELYQNKSKLKLEIYTIKY